MTPNRCSLPLVFCLAWLLWAGVAGAASAPPTPDSPVAAEEKTLLHFTFGDCAPAEGVELPGGAEVQAASGLFTWLPAYGSAGAHVARVRCGDGQIRSATIQVAAAEPLYLTTNAPRVTLADTPTGSQAADENDQRSWAAVAGLYGLDVTEEADLGAAFDGGRVGAILIVPWHVARNLDAGVVERIAAYVQDGGRLLLSGRSPLSEALGVDFEDTTVTVTSFQDYLNPTFPLIWSQGEVVERFALAPDDAVFTATPDGATPLALGRRVGRGRLLYLATERYDRHSPYGTKGHPYLVYHVADFFKLRSRISAGSLDVYFDPGNYDLTVVRVEDLVQRWSELGIKTVYAAAWHAWVDEATGAAWTFGYDHFLEVCHQRGIRVYAWFAFPHVSQKFWVERPECREQTALHGEEYVFWRLMVNLQNPACLGDALGLFEQVVRVHAWDGINIAEIYYDYALDVGYLTPMNDAVLADYTERFGYSPTEFFTAGSLYDRLLNPTEWRRFIDYRSGLVTDLHHTFLDRGSRLAAELGMELVLTPVDNLHYDYPDLVQPIGDDVAETGVDMVEIVGLRERYDVTLQVEDPWPLWSSNPLRYGDYDATYKGRFPELAASPDLLYFDINIVNSAHAGGEGAVPLADFPADRQTGVEVATLIAHTYGTSGRLALFSENSMAPLDLERAREFLAATVELTAQADGSWLVSAAHPARLAAPTPFDSVRVDGRPWPGWSAVTRQVVLPVGEHRVEFETGGAPPSLRLADSSAELLEATAVEEGIEVRYRSPRQRAVLTVEAFGVTGAEAFTVTLDGAPHTPPIYSFYGHYHLFLPRGEHAVRVTAATEAAGVPPATAESAGSDEICFIAQVPSLAVGWWFTLGTLALAASATRLRRKTS